MSKMDYKKPRDELMKQARNIPVFSTVSHGLYALAYKARRYRTGLISYPLLGLDVQLFPNQFYRETHCRRTKVVSLSKKYGEQDPMNTNSICIPWPHLPYLTIDVYIRRCEEPYRSYYLAHEQGHAVAALGQARKLMEVVAASNLQVRDIEFKAAEENDTLMNETPLALLTEKEFKKWEDDFFARLDEFDTQYSDMQENFGNRAAELSLARQGMSLTQIALHHIEVFSLG